MTAPAAPRPAPPLDDVMLAMDVVDTLRHRQQLVERELDEPARRQDLIERLRKIYAAQGIDVSDEILSQGVDALAQERFVYRPAPPSFATTLARIYVTRRVWGAALLVVLVVAMVTTALYRTQVVAPRLALPGELAAAHDAVVQVAEAPDAVARADALYGVAETALAKGDRTAARSVLASLEALRTEVASAYTVRVVNRPDEASGVWRVPDANEDARNYYLIVEGIDAGGRRVSATVRNEETREYQTVARWGVRVDQATFEAVARDKQDDGIIQGDVIGEKRAGALTPTYTVPTDGAAITSW